MPRVASSLSTEQNSSLTRALFPLPAEMPKDGRGGDFSTLVNASLPIGCPYVCAAVYFIDAAGKYRLKVVFEHLLCLWLIPLSVRITLYCIRISPCCRRAVLPPCRGRNDRKEGGGLVRIDQSDGPRGLGWRSERCRSPAQQRQLREQANRSSGWNLPSDLLRGRPWYSHPSVLPPYRAATVSWIGKVSASRLPSLLD
jgi:hypothetical protein